MSILQKSTLKVFKKHYVYRWSTSVFCGVCRIKFSLGKTAIRKVWETPLPKPYKTCCLLIILSHHLWKGPKYNQKLLCLQGSCNVLYIVSPLFKSIWIHRSNCVFGECDIVQIHLHWELLNPFENLLQMQRSPCHFPKMTPKSLQIPCKTLIKPNLFHCIAQAAETLINVDENWTFWTPQNAFWGSSDPLGPSRSKK